jgi:hypothetical protein
MDSKGVFEDNKLQKRIPEYDHYAKKSLTLGIIGLVLPFLFLLELRIWSRLSSMGSISNNILVYSFFVFVIVYLTFSISGIVFGKKGLKSNKLRLSKAGLAVSIIGLSIPVLVIIIIIVYVLAGGEFM